MTSDRPAPFTPEVVAAVTAHMNADHPEDNLLIARSLGGLPAATDAAMVDVDEAGAHFEGVVGGRPVRTVVPWGGPVAERAAIRHEVVRMYHEACAALGVEPRQPGEH